MWGGGRWLPILVFLLTVMTGCGLKTMRCLFKYHPDLQIINPTRVCQSITLTRAVLSCFSPQATNPPLWDHCPRLISNNTLSIYLSIMWPSRIILTLKGPGVSVRFVGEIVKLLHVLLVWFACRPQSFMQSIILSDAARFQGLHVHGGAVAPTNTKGRKEEETEEQGKRKEKQVV